MVATGASLLQSFGTCRVVADTLETSAHALRTEAHSRAVSIHGIDHQSADTFVQRVAGNALQTSHTAVVVASEDVRMDGKRVTVG